MACLICGNSDEFSRSVKSGWKKEYTAATCQVLFDNKSEYFIDYFQNANYCSRCEQVIGDLGFTWKQIQSLQKQILNLLDSNYQQIEEKSEAKVVQEKISSFLLQPATSKFSFKEMVEIIYTVVSNRQSRDETDSAGSESVIRNWSSQSQTDLVTPKTEIPLPHEESSNNISINTAVYSDTENCLEDSSGEMKLRSCCHCQEIFCDEETLKQHISCTHENKKMMYSVECWFCGKKYATQDELNLHYSKSHPKENPFRCAFCPEVYLNCRGLRKHTREMHPNPIVNPKCDICGKRYTSNHYLTEHRLRAHEDKTNWLFKCLECDKKFARESWLTEHMKTHSYCEPKYKCDVCGKLFKQEKPLSVHKYNFHREGGYKCDVCAEIFETMQQLRTHKISHRKKVMKKRKKKIVPRSIIINHHNCKFCGKRYSNEEELNSHYSEAHQGPNPFTCAFCSDIFSNSVDLQKHTKSVHGDPPILIGKFKCDSCDKTFKYNSKLQKHALLHRDRNKIVRCDFCLVPFPDLDSLKKHALCHSEQPKNVVCETCGKSFKNMRYLKVHSRIHDESARKVKCKVCDRRFFTGPQCKVHERTHTDIKEFVCNVCGKAFNHTGNLSEHIKTHTGLPSRIRKRKPKQ